MATVRPERASVWRAMGRALAHRNYRLFFAGQGVSLIGTWMTRLATGWLVFRLAQADAPFWLGMVSFAGLIPAFILAPLAGALVDRWNRHRLLIITQVLAMVQSALLAVVAFRAEPGMSTIWQVMVLSVFQGLINAFDMPARQALLVEMVERREDLPNAIALNSSLFNGARLVGPSVAGAVIATVGEAWCFAIDSISYVAVVAALLLMRLPRRERVIPRGSVARHVWEGARYVFEFVPVRALLALLALISFAAMPYSVLLPVFAGEVLHGGPYVLGFLSGASGIGALSGALYLASRRTVLGLGRVIVVATLILGVGLMGFALSKVLWLSMALMLATGFGMMVQMAASNTIIQTVVDEDKRGRVMSFYSMAFQGAAPFGSLLAGALAGRIGAPDTVLLSGLVCLAGGLVFGLQLPRLRAYTRPVYTRLGILPEVAGGLQAADSTPPVRP